MYRPRRKEMGRFQRQRELREYIFNLLHFVKNGVKVGITKGVKLTTKKSIECKKIILKHSKDFGGSLTDIDVIKLCGCSRQSYYKYKAEIKRTSP